MDASLSFPVRGNTAGGPVIQTAASTQFLWFHHLNPCENAFAALYAGVAIQLHQSSKLLDAAIAILW
jgi:hypothetical protein